MSLGDHHVGEETDSGNRQPAQDSASNTAIAGTSLTR